MHSSTVSRVACKPALRLRPSMPSYRFSVTATPVAISLHKQSMGQYCFFRTSKRTRLPKTSMLPSYNYLRMAISRYRLISPALYLPLHKTYSKPYVSCIDITRVRRPADNMLLLTRSSTTASQLFWPTDSAKRPSFSRLRPMFQTFVRTSVA